jgi:hypothetical protein
MLQAKLGAAGAVLALVAHTAYVQSERAKAPTGRLLQFSPGSQGESKRARCRRLRGLPSSRPLPPSLPPSLARCR